MFCTRCGNVIPDDSVFCVKCGHPVEQADDSGGSSPFGDVRQEAASFMPDVTNAAFAPSEERPFSSPAPIQDTAKIPYALQTSVATRGCFGSGWDDVKNSDGVIKKLAILALIGLVPILNWVNQGYGWNWSKELVKGTRSSMSDAIINAENFKMGAFATVITVLVIVVLGVVDYLLQMIPVVGIVLSLVLGFVVGIFMSLSIIRIAICERFGAGFQLDKVFEGVKRNVGSLLLIYFVPGLIVVVLGIFIWGVYFFVAAPACKIDTMTLLSLAGQSVLTGESYSSLLGSEVGGSMAMLLIMGLVALYLTSIVVQFCTLVEQRALGHYVERVIPEWAYEAPDGYVVNAGASSIFASADVQPSSLSSPSPSPSSSYASSAFFTDTSFDSTFVPVSGGTDATWDSWITPETVYQTSAESTTAKNEAPESLSHLVAAASGAYSAAVSDRDDSVQDERNRCERSVELADDMRKPGTVESFGTMFEPAFEQVLEPAPEPAFEPEPEPAPEPAFEPEPVLEPEPRRAVSEPAVAIDHGREPGGADIRSSSVSAPAPEPAFDPDLALESKSPLEPEPRVAVPGPVVASEPSPKPKHAKAAFDASKAARSATSSNMATMVAAPQASAVVNVAENRPAREVSLRLRRLNGETCRPKVFPVVIGSDEHANWVIDNPKVSRFHLRIVREGDIFLAEDLESTNKTIIDNQVLPPYTPTVLKHGDKLRLSSDEVLSVIIVNG